MKIVTVVGARPQFIKVAAVRRAIERFNKRKRRVDEVLVHTGQHYDYLMDKVFFEELELLKPDYHLGVGSGSHAEQTGMMLERIEAVLGKEKPEWVVVYGDTNSTLAGALAAAKLNLPVAHVEAGLRSYDRAMPEEINRVLTDHLSTILFCPTKHSVKNLAREGIKNGEKRTVMNVGDVMYDSILHYSKIAEKKSTILKDLGLITTEDSKIPQSTMPARPAGPEPCWFRAGGLVPHYYLATLHRAENTDHPNRLRSILKALNQIGKTVPVVLPLHPRTRKRMDGHDLFSGNRWVRFIEPIPYLAMLKLEKNASAILTDSGGVQKEAYWFKVPCLTLRDETEWVETVKDGWNVLVGIEPERIVREIGRLEKGNLFKKGTRKESISTRSFGDGKASEKIVQILIGCST